MYTRRAKAEMIFMAETTEDSAQEIVEEVLSKEPDCAKNRFKYLVKM